MVNNGLNPKRIGKASFAVLLITLLPSLLWGQSTHLDRISLATRSDGKGYVARYHLSQPVDSFNVFQPEPDLIQMAIFQPSIDTSDITIPAADSDVLDEVSLHKIPNGYGIDFYLSKGHHFIAEAYPDKNGNDLLLNLTNATSDDIKFMTEGLEPIIWSKLRVPQGTVATATDDIDYSDSLEQDDSYQLAKDKMKFDVVVIDAGHGGKDPGSIGYRGIKEKDVVLDVALKLGEYINEYLPDVKVVYTRKTDKFIGLKERGTIANKAEGDLFVSIHCNSFKERRAKGSEVYFLGLHRSKEAFEVMKQENSVIKLEDDPQKTELTQNELLIYELANRGYMSVSEQIAGMVEHQFDDRAQRRSRGVKQAGFIVLYHASMPAILTELGFISNPSEARFLTSDYGKAIMASAIFRAIRDYKNKYEKSQHFTTN